MFNQKLKQIRKEHKVTQKQLAQDIGVSTSTIGMYEQGRRDPDTEMLMTLAEYFGVSSDYLLDARSDFSDDMNSTDKKEITTILETAKNALITQEGVLFDGQPLSEESAQLILDALKLGMERAKFRNKKFANKSRK